MDTQTKIDYLSDKLTPISDYEQELYEFYELMDFKTLDILQMLVHRRARNERVALKKMNLEYTKYIEGIV